MSAPVRLRRHSAGIYTAQLPNGKVYEVRHSGPDCWSYWPEGAPGAADAECTLAEVRETLSRIGAR